MKRRHGAAASALALATLAMALAAILIAGVASAIPFEPAFGANVSDPSPGAGADVTTQFSIPAPDANFAMEVTFTPSDFTVATDADVPNGAVMGFLQANATLGLINGPCNSALPVAFDMMDAATNPSITVTYDEQFQDADANGLPDGVDKYPDFLTRMFPGLTPRARQYGQASVAGSALSMNFVIFEPGVTLPTFGSLNPALGYPSVTVLANIGDPGIIPAPTPITDFCTPLSTVSTTFGMSQDNFATPADEGGAIVRRNPLSPGVYDFTARSLSQPDADDDNIENQLDTCPYVGNLGDPRAPGSGDMDNDGIDDACDPMPTVTMVDEDGDAYTNRGDNCPLVANGFDPDNQRDSDGDGIGDSCDVNPNISDGTMVDMTNTAAVEIGGVPPTPPVTPTATPTGTPSPLPANDDFDSAAVIPELPFADFMDTRAATTAFDDPNCAGRGHTVWYSFTPPQDMRIEANTFGSNYDTTLSVYTGVRGALSQIACNDDTEDLQSLVSFNAFAGETYFFMVGAFGGGPGGDLVFTVNFVPPLEVALSIDPDGSVVARTGATTVTGTITCSKPASVELFGELRQRAGRVIIRGFFFDSLYCDGQASWSATVVGDDGLFKAGRVEVSATAWAFGNDESVVAQASATVKLTGSQPIELCPRKGNDNFEAGTADTNVVPCWTAVDQGSGGWCNQTGTTPPQGYCSGSLIEVDAPPEGAQAVMTNQPGPGSHVLYRCGVLRSRAISFELYINNENWDFASPASLDYSVYPNQQVRADLVTETGMVADPFTVAPTDILFNIYQTQPGDPPVSNYTTVTADVREYAGDRVCLRFAEVDNQFFQHAGVDEVNIDLRAAR